MLREIRTLKQHSHPNIVRLLQVFREEERLMLVFEFVERTVLEELERHSSGLPGLQVKEIMFQSLKALSFLH